MPLSPLAALLATYKDGALPEEQVRFCLSRANGNASRNTYIALDPGWTLAEARRQTARESSLPLFGIPVALKDCFDLAGFRTTSGSRFYAEHLPPAAADSWVAAQLRRAGAVITGKVHLHQLTFGITGENHDYGDCLQPANSALLTGGSSSGSAAAVQEGSALAAIGTDTGGSVRAPAALCGLAGYRSSLGLGDWSGGYHLSESFDTIGWLFRDLRDATRLAEALFNLPPEPQPSPAAPSIGVLAGPLVEPCDPEVRRSLEFWQEQLRRAAARLEPVEPAFWSEAWDIYAPIQAAEAARLHTGHFQEFEPAIAARLAWGASLPEEQLREFRTRRQSFCEQNNALFRRFDFVLAPITPISRLLAGADHSETRPQILRLTTPASVAGLPAIVLPSPDCGLQLLAQRNNDRRLLRFASLLGDRLAADHA
ncbi:MAG TPA: amidase [Acidobacteriaceae bacterium]|jgi:aspartyl-tRNA(Asn)/glutamyl-tRNA(Gln) amidotransferase subunit A